MIKIDEKFDARWGDPANQWSGKKVRTFLQDTLKEIIGAVNQNETDIKSKNELKEVKYADLVQLRNESKLVAGNLYRITDYETTVANNENARSAGHPFDVIVLALAANILSEEAMAIQSTRDGGYFNDCKLEAWKLWYYLDNDEDRYQWADKTKGKGIIYRMIDEWGNDCPYDFKNVQFKRCKVTSTSVPDLNNTYVGIIGISQQGLTKIESDFIWCYTFSKRRFNVSTSQMTWEIEGDASLENIATRYYIEEEFEWYFSSPASCVLNVLGERYLFEREDTKAILCLNDIVFLSGYCEDQGYGTFYPSYIVNRNILGFDCHNMTFVGRAYSNRFNDSCNNNAFSDDFSYNQFGNYCYRNSFGNGFSNNSFGDYFKNNTFGNNCYGNQFGNDCSNNSFGNYFQYNTFGSTCYNNQFGNNFQYNTFGNNCSGNQFGSNCSGNQFGNHCYSLRLGNSCTYNSFGNNCYGNQFGNNFNLNSIGENVQFISILTERIQNVHILNGTKGTNNSNTLTINFVAEKKSSQYAGLNSSGTLKIWTPADLV